MEEDQWGIHAAIQKMFICPTPMNVPTHLLLSSFLSYHFLQLALLVLLVSANTLVLCYF